MAFPTTSSQTQAAHKAAMTLPASRLAVLRLYCRLGRSRQVSAGLQDLTECPIPASHFPEAVRQLTTLSRLSHRVIYA